MTTSDVRLQSVIYPEGDGEPVGETDIHRRLMFDLIFALTNWLNQTIAYVAGNLFIYYEEGNPVAAIAPDVFVIPGVSQAVHRIYKSWEGDTLRFYEVGSDMALPTPAEEREARLAAEAEVERLRAELERLRAGNQ